MLWGYFHLLIILTLIVYTRRSEPHFHAAIALLVWFTLRNLGYEYGQIETESVYQTMAAFILLCIIGYVRHRLMLFLGMAGIGGAVCVYNGLHAHDAYTFKTVLGMLFQLVILAVFLTCRNSRRLSLKY